MAYIAFASAKGSPGVTTAVTALAAAWPAERALLVAEVDPSGGDLVVRLDLATEPGLVSLAAAGRRELGADRLIEHTQVLAAPGGAEGAVRRVLVAPVSAEQATVSLSALRGGLGRVLDELDLDVLVDCGRLDPSSPAFDLAVNASLLVMVARPVVAEVHHLSSRLASAKPRAVSLLLVGDRPYSVAEVGATVGASPLGTLPVDVRAAAVLSEGHPHAGRVLRRAALLRDARALAEGLCEWLGPQAGSTPVPPPAATPPTVAPSPPSAPSPPTVAPSPPTGPSPAAGSQPPAPLRPESAPAASPSPGGLAPPTTAPVPLPPPPSSHADDHGADSPSTFSRPPDGPPARSTGRTGPPPARFSPTLPTRDAAPAPAARSPLPPPVAPLADERSSASATTTYATPEWAPAPAPVSAPAEPPVEPGRSGDAWAAAAADDGRSGRLNGRRRLGGTPKHFRRDPEDESR